MSVQALQQAAESRRFYLCVRQRASPSASKKSPKSLNTPSSTPHPRSIHNPPASSCSLARNTKKYGDITAGELRKIVPADKFEPTTNKLNMFKAAAGTVLFFEDQTVVQGLQAQFPAYAANFPIWSEHTNGMHQYAIWTTLAAARIGANLQHYNPIIDAEIAKTWNIPAAWTLRAQLVFGGIAAPAGEKEFQPVEERLKVFGL